jgi:hypothetical protein
MTDTRVKDKPQMDADAINKGKKPGFNPYLCPKKALRKTHVISNGRRPERSCKVVADSKLEDFSSQAPRNDKIFYVGIKKNLRPCALVCD